MLDHDKKLSANSDLLSLFIRAPNLTIIVSILCLILSLTSCISPVILDQAVLQYDEAVNQTQSKMLLLNIARARHYLPTHFTSVSNIAATYNFEVNAGITGGVIEEGDTLFGVLGGSAAENPTISIIPFQGEEFTKRLLTPTDETKFEFLFHREADMGILLRLMATAIFFEEDGKRVIYRNDPRYPGEYTEFRRRVLHLSYLDESQKLDVGAIQYEEEWPIPKGQPPSSQDLINALESGFSWEIDEEGKAYILSKKLTGRMLIANYDPDQLSNKERRKLQDRAQQFPRYFILVDIRPGYPGGDYPFQGWIKLRNFNGIIEFIARGIADSPEFDVVKDARTGPVLRNPAKTLDIKETNREPLDAALTVGFRGKVYSIANKPDEEGIFGKWDREAFEVLYQLFQMTVTDLTRVPVPPITISK